MKALVFGIAFFLICTSQMFGQVVNLPKGQHVLTCDLVGLKFPYEIDNRSRANGVDFNTEAGEIGFAVGEGTVFEFESQTPSEEGIIMIKLVTIKPIKNKIIIDSIDKKKKVDGFYIVRALDSKDSGIVKLPYSQLKFYEPYGIRFAAGGLVIPFKFILYPDTKLSIGSNLGGYIGFKINASKEYAHIGCFSAGILITENDIPINLYASIGYIGQISENFQLAIIVGSDFPANPNFWISFGTGFLFSK